MLRLRPTVISITPAEVTEVIHRRRFRKYLLEADKRTMPHKYDFVDKPATTPLQTTSSSGSPEREVTPQERGKRVASPRGIRAVISPEDSPVSSPFQEDLSPLPESPTRGEHHRRTEDDDPPSTSVLCVRTKPATDPDEVTIFSNSPVTSPPSTPRRQSPGSGRSRRWKGKETVAFSSRWTSSRPSHSAERAISHSPPGPIQTPVDGTDEGWYSSVHRSAPRRSSSLGSPVHPKRTSALFGPTRFSSAGLPSRTSTGFNVFSDFLPAFSQPRTPRNLPEAHHQSRLHGSYTAPARRTSPQQAGTPTTSRVRDRLGRRREPSPMGLQTPGFKGLYGGVENTDDAALFEQVEEDLQAEASRPESVG